MVVSYQRISGTDGFNWGVVGNIPMLVLVGAVARVQAADITRPDDDHVCPEPALVITWDRDTNTTHWYAHPNLPIDSLMGMLEIIKATLVANLIAQQQQHKLVDRALLGPDGQPMRW